MTRITAWAFRHKAGVLVSVILVLALGIVSYFSLPKEFLPSLDAPEIMVTVMGQGIDAATMADEVATPIEDAVNTVQGKTDVTSTSSDGFTEITIGFDANTKMKDAKQAVSDAISNVQLPDGVAKPNVVQLNTSMIPVADVSLTFANGITDQTLNQVKHDIVPLFQGVNGVASAGVYGDNPSQVVINLNKDEMAKRHVPLQSVMTVLQGQNLTIAVGETTVNQEAANIKVVGSIDSLDALKGLTIAPGTTLGDISSITTAPSGQNVTHVDGKDAILIIVSKSADSNAVTVTQDVQKVVDKVNQQYGPSIHASIPYATSNMVLNAVNGMMREVLMGALFATIVILLFLRSIRMTMITIVSIPLSLGLTLFLLSESGVTLNIITLGGVAVAVGRLVDDSIVVIENIFRKLQLEGHSKQTILTAVREVATAITASTLTTIAVFLPMGLIQGSIRQLMFPFALTMVYSLISSLLVALTVVPLLSSGLLRKAKLRDHKKPEGFARFVRWNLAHKWVTLSLSLVLFVGSLVTYFAVPKGAIDSADNSEVNVTLTYPSSTPYDVVKAGAEQLEQFIVQQPQTKTTLLMLGNSSANAQYGQLQSPTQATLNVIMQDGANADTFIQNVNTQKSKYPNATLDALAPQGFGGSNTINIDVFGKNANDLLTASDKVMNTVKGIDGVQKVTSNQADVHPTYEIQVNPSVANAQQIAMQLRSMLNQVPIGTMKLNDNSTNVVVNPFLNVNSPDELNNIQIATQSGLTALGKIATITKVDRPGTVLRKNGDEYVEVGVVVNPQKLSQTATQIALKTKSLSLPNGVTLSTGGAVNTQSSEFGDLFKTMMAAIGLVYLIMVLTFRTLRAPLVILFSLPLAAVGAMLGLVITGSSVDPTSLIGALMLIGIVVTNAIVLIDKVKQNEEHMTIRDALVDAAATRMRPILMTAVATVCAMLPLVFSKPESGSLVSKGLAIVVIGGLSVATMLTLVVIPCMYELFHFRASRRQRKAQAAGPQTKPSLAPNP